MKKLLLTSTMMFMVLCAFSQNSFEIIKIGTTYTTDQITTALVSADLCGSYFQTKRNTLEFNDGTIVELKSKNEIDNLGLSYPFSCFIEDNVHYFKAIWSINDVGMIMKGFDNSAYPTEKEYYHYNQINKQ